MECCYDETQCRVKEGFENSRRSLYMRYTVKWVDWYNSIVPVKIYIFDITDTWKKSDESTGLSSRHVCHIEYNVESCATDVVYESCIDSRRVSVSLPTGGDVIYGVAHQHTGGLVHLFMERMDELYAHQYQLMEKERKQEMRLVTLWECPPVILNQVLSGFWTGRLYLWYLITAVPKDILVLWGSLTL